MYLKCTRKTKVTVTYGIDEARLYFEGGEFSCAHEVIVSKTLWPVSGASVRIDGKSPIQLHFDSRNGFPESLGEVLDREIGTVSDGKRPPLLDKAFEIFDKLKLRGIQTNSHASYSPLRAVG